MFNQKGQEAAPFELLIAVIVMTFVILVGLSAMNVLIEKECEGKIDSQLEELKTVIEKVAGGEGKGSAFFRLPGCFKQEESQVEIVYRDDRRLCTYFCGSGEQCTLLMFSSPKYSNTKCLRISSATVFPGDPADNIGSPCDPSIWEHGATEYCVDKWKEAPIKEGQYILVRDPSQYTDNPMVCVYRVKQGERC